MEHGIHFLMFVQLENENQRARNQELVEMQEKSSIRQEQARRQTEEQIQALQLQTEKEKHREERETLQAREMAAAEARAHEAKVTEDTSRRMLEVRMKMEKEKLELVIKEIFHHIGGANLSFMRLSFRVNIIFKRKLRS